MKLYGFTCIDTSAPYENGGESMTRIYISRDEAIRHAYYSYAADFYNICKDNDFVDELGNTQTKMEDFLKHGPEAINGPDFHVQYELFEDEI